MEMQSVNGCIFLIYSNMVIFNKQIFGTDANEWLEKPTMEQVEWIKTYTNQQDDDVIDEFLSNITKGTDKQCLNCGENGNISKGISETVEQSNEPELLAEQSKTDSDKRSKNAKARKN